MCLKIYELDPDRFLLYQNYQWQAALKKAKVKLRLLSVIDMLLMIEKDNGGGICYATLRYGKRNDTYINDYDKNKESSFVKYWNANDLHGWTKSQKLPWNNFILIEDISEFDKSFIKSYNDESDEWCFLKVDIQQLEKLQNLSNDISFLP